MFKTTNRIQPARHVLVTDKAVQGALLVRLVLYGISCLLYFSIIQLLDVALADPVQSHWDIACMFFGEAIYWAPGLFVIMPILAYDLLRVSNRFTGPVTRLRKEMRHLTAGESVEPIEFRDEDFWGEMADEYNLLREEVVKLRNELASAQKSNGATAQNAVRKGTLFGKKLNANPQNAEAPEELLETVGV